MDRAAWKSIAMVYGGQFVLLVSHWVLQMSLAKQWALRVPNRPLGLRDVLKVMARISAGQLLLCLAKSLVLDKKWIYCLVPMMMGTTFFARPRKASCLLVLARAMRKGAARKV